MSELTDKVALVTGSSRGLGRAIALGLAAAGADVAVNYRTNRKEADAVVAAIRKLGRRAIAIGADVSQQAEVTRLVGETKAQLGPRSEEHTSELQSRPHLVCRLL